MSKEVIERLAILETKMDTINKKLDEGHVCVQIATVAGMKNELTWHRRIMLGYTAVVLWLNKQALWLLIQKAFT